MTIGDLLIRVIADMKDFQADTVKEAEKAGDKAGASFSKSLGSALKTAGIKAIGVGLAAAFGIAAKGALELENATARFRAETGATAEQAAAMGKAINRIAGEERTSLEAVTDIAIRVKNDMGATGDAAVELTKRFTQFARVTRQDGAESVKAFDDILDSWGLTADRTGEIMDKLIVSQHKFGGDLAQTEDSIARLAPAFRAANFEIDDAIALMGLFGSKGLDAQQGAAAFAKALTKVHSPEELQYLIKDIAATVDPFQRASKAADLFGAKAGAKLANALGGANLDDYKISVEESTGALQQAADVLDNTFSGRIQKAISEATANLREFGAAFGPVLAGVGGLASLFATAGGGSLLKPLLKPLVAFPAVFKKAIVNGIMAAVVPAKIAGEAVGVAEAEGMAEGMAGSKAMGIVKGPLSIVGKIWGSILGKAFVLGALAVIGVELLDQLRQQVEANKSQSHDIGENVGNEIASGTVESLEQSRAALQKAISDLVPLSFLTSKQFTHQDELERQLDEVNKALLARQQDADRVAAANASKAGAATVEAFGEGAKSALPGVQQTAGTGISSMLAKAASDAAVAARKAGQDTMQAFAKGILDAQSVVGSAFAALKNQQDTEMSTVEEEAYVIGILTSKQLADGLKDGRAGVRAQAEATQQIALDRLNELARSGKPLGKKAMEELNAGLKSKNPTIRKTSEDIAKIIKSHSSKDTKKGGQDAGDKINSGLKSKKGLIGSTAWLIGKGIAENVARSIIEQAQRDYGSVGHPGRAAGGPVYAGQAYIVGERRPEVFVPNSDGYIIPQVPTNFSGGGSSSGSPVNITVALPVSARPSPFETAHQLRRLADLHLLTPERY